MIRIACTAINRRINAGKVNKAGTDFIGNPVDVTSDCLKAVIDKIGAGNVEQITADGVPVYEIEIRAISRPANDEDLASVFDYPKASLKREDWDPATRKPKATVEPMSTAGPACQGGNTQPVSVESTRPAEACSPFPNSESGTMPRSYAPEVDVEAERRSARENLRSSGKVPMVGWTLSDAYSEGWLAARTQADAGKEREQYTCERHRDEVKKGGACAWCQLEAARPTGASPDQEPLSVDDYIDALTLVLNASMRYGPEGSKLVQTEEMARFYFKHIVQPPKADDLEKAAEPK